MSVTALSFPTPASLGSLDQYIQAVNRFPLLTAEQEVELGRRWQRDQDLAAARELLIDLAADHGKFRRGSLEVADGKVIHPPSNRSFTFGELSKGKKLTKTVELDEPVTAATEWKIAGTSVPKVDGRALVTGRHKYASDVSLPGMLHGKILRPATLKASLASVNLKKAEEIPGVIAVRDGDFIETLS